MLGPPDAPAAGPTPRRSYYDEHLALRMAEEEGLKVTILRLFNAYGARNHPSWWGGPLSVFFEDLLDGREMDLHGDGRQIRSFTYVSDTVDGFVRALRAPETSGEVINIGDDEPIAIVELAAKVQEAVGIEGPLRARIVPLESIGGNYQDVRHRIPDLTKARAPARLRAAGVAGGGPAEDPRLAPRPPPGGCRGRMSAPAAPCTARLRSALEAPAGTAPGLRCTPSIAPTRR